MTGASSEQLVAVRVSASALKTVMEQRLHDPDFRLPLRMRTLLKEFSQWELNGEGEVDVFSLMVRLVLWTDELPVHTLVDLLSSFDDASVDSLEPFTIANAALMIKGYLLKEDILKALEKYAEVEPV